MKVTMVGSGDAFGTGGRAHTCIRLDCLASTVIVDFGSSSITSWNRLGFKSNDIDAIVISHLHGDHFGGLPNLLLECQFESSRTKALPIFGPPGLKARMGLMQDFLFPSMAKISWTFDWPVYEISPGEITQAAGLRLETFEVIHSSIGIATGVRLTGSDGIFAYSGDTTWTDNLLPLGADADLFVIECFAGYDNVPNHLNWPKLREELPSFSAKRIVLTHLGATALPLTAEMEAAGVVVAYDGLTIEF